jgi:SAM-dependent methyltransferase
MTQIAHLYSKEFYDNIWMPYLSFSRLFAKNNPPSLRSFLKVCKLLSRYERLFHDKKFRQIQDLENFDWAKATSDYDKNSIYMEVYFNFQRFWFSTKGWHDFWSCFVRSYVLNYNYQKSRTFIDLGCGIGTSLFDLYAYTLDDQSRFYGLERSAVGLECASIISGLLKSEENFPLFEFFNQDIAQIKGPIFDCDKLDTVIYSVSSLRA